MCLSVGTCTCNEGWSGSDCTVNVTKAPEIYYVDGGGLCNGQLQDCLDITVIGVNFADTDSLVCLVEKITVSENTL